MPSGVVATVLQVSVLLSLCAACRPLVIDFSAGNAGNPVPRIEGCAVRIAEVVDERHNKDDLGLFNGQVVEGRAVMPWLQQAVASLNAPDVETDGRSPDRARLRQVTGQVGLTQLYVEHLPHTLAGTIVLHATYQINQGSLYAHQYRGADTKMNWQEALMGADWTGSAGSVRTLFNDVLDDVVRQMHADIQQHCQSGQAKSGT